MGRSAISKIITIDGRYDHMPEAELSHSISDILRLIRCKRSG